MNAITLWCIVQVNKTLDTKAIYWIYDTEEEAAAQWESSFPPDYQRIERDGDVEFQHSRLPDVVYVMRRMSLAGVLNATIAGVNMLSRMGSKWHS